MLYDAMFTRTTRLHFSARDTVAPLIIAYAETRVALATIACGRDANILTELLWAALHGLITLRRNDRLRPGHDAERDDLLVAQLRTADSQHQSEQP